MERTLVNVAENGHVILSDEVKTRLGIPSGGEVELVLGERSVELRPKRPCLSKAELHRKIDELQSLFARQPGERSLEDDLYEMRREEQEHSRRKFGC